MFQLWIDDQKWKPVFSPASHHSIDAVAIFLASFPCCLYSYCLTVFIFLWYKYFPDSSVGKESTCNARDLGLIPGLGRYPGDRKRYPFQYSVLGNSGDCIVHGITKSRTQLSDSHFKDFPVAHMVKNLPAMQETSSIPGSGKSSGEGNSKPLPYSCLENPMDKGAWWTTVCGVVKSRTQVSD